MTKNNNLTVRTSFLDPENMGKNKDLLSTTNINS